MAPAAARRRLARIASHVAAARTAALTLADDAEAAFTPAEIIRRCIGLGATDEQLDDCVHQPDTEAALRRLADSLRPPPSTGVTVADLSVGRDASVEAIVERLDRYGACVIERLASDELIEQVEVQCTAAGAWDAKTIEGTGSNQIMERMCHEIITSAPSVATLLEQPLVLAAVSSVLCRSAKRVALKQVEVFELKPGQGSPGGFHREDQNWPWHHEPYPWAVDVLWAITPFTEANGGTELIPYSHRWLRQAKRVDRGQPGHPTPWEADNGRAKYSGILDEQVVRCAMPRGSVLLFSGAVLHSAGRNDSAEGRRTLLSGYQLSWLRPENNFWGHTPLREAIHNGKGPSFSKTFVELLGHWDPETARVEEKAGGYREVRYLGRTKEEVLADAGRHHMTGSRGYEEFG